MNTIVEEVEDLEEGNKMQGFSLFDHELTDQLEDNPRRLESLKCGEDWPNKERYNSASHLTDPELEIEARWIAKVLRRLRSELSKLKKEAVITKIKSLLRRTLIDKICVCSNYSRSSISSTSRKTCSP